MYLYVTENIDYYHKIGIADDYYSRLKNYRTIIPDLEFDFHIPLINRKMGELFERTLKSHLRVFRLGKSECYQIDIDSIKKTILGYTLLIQYPVLEYNINPYNYPSEFQFSNSREAFREGHKTSVIFLNEIYFGKKIPLIKVEKRRGQKIKFYVIKNTNLKELSNLCGKIESLFDDYNIAFNNKLFSYLEELHDTEHKIDYKSKNIIKFLSKHIWNALSQYFTGRSDLSKNKKIISINSYSKKNTEDFNLLCIKKSLRNIELNNYRDLQFSKIPGTWILDVSTFKRLKNTK